MTQIKLLDSLARIHSHLLSNKICYNDFDCTVDMIKLPSSESSSVDDDETMYLEDILHLLASIVSKM